MSRRIDVELTSARDDGTWTWRAAGARQPKGVLDGALLYEGAKVGDVVRAEADFDVDGITITAVLPPKGQRREPERLEVVGPEREFKPVTSTLAKRERGDRPDRPRRDRDRERRPGGGRPERGRREGGPRPAGAGERGSERPRRERPAPPPPRPKAKKLRPRRTHRDAFLASLPPEQQPIAEQALRGGMPAVRTALHEQNSKAKAEGKPEVPVQAVLAIAEELLPAVRLVEWIDRAEAALADAEELSLQDLRSVVVSSSDVARDERAQEMANQLRAVLDRRVPAEQQQWVADVEQSLTAGRVVRALRLAARPPQPNETLPEELTTRLAESAGAAMTADIEPQRWATVLDAVAYSPLRRSVVPAGVPAEPGDELLALVRKHAGRSPAIAALFGVEPPPQKEGRRARRGPGRGATGTETGAPTTAGAVLGGPILGPDGRRIPPPPPRQQPEAADAGMAAGDAPADTGGQADSTTSVPETATAAPGDTDVPADDAPPETAGAASVPSDAPGAPEPDQTQPSEQADPSEEPAGREQPAADRPEQQLGASGDEAPSSPPAAGSGAPSTNGGSSEHPVAEVGGDDPRAHGDRVLDPQVAPTQPSPAEHPVAEVGGDDPRAHGDGVLEPHGSPTQPPAAEGAEQRDAESVEGSTG